jgi:antitoxin CptB
MSQNTYLKRLQYRSLHRGCKETDLVLGNFAESALGALEAPQLALYERLLDEDDADIWDWLTGKTIPPVPEYIPLLDMLKGYGLPQG